VNDGFWDAEEISSQLIKYELRQVGTVEKPALHVEIVGMRPESSAITIDIKNYLTRILRLDDELNEFYLKFRSDPLAITFNRLRGLRLMLASNTFEALICSIASQNTSIKRWNNTIQLIKKRFGRKVRFPDGSIFYTFPEPASLVRAGERAVRSCKAGYRTRYILTASRLVAEGEMDLTELSNMDFNEARKTLLKICGVGPKVADCFLLYGLGSTQAAPVDVWTHRIVQQVYKKAMTVNQAGCFLRRRFGSWTGYAGLYLFHYARLRDRDPYC